MRLLSFTVISLFTVFIDGLHQSRSLSEDHRLTPREAEVACDSSEYRLWDNTTVPSDFPLPLSKDLSGYQYAPECASRYGNAGAWFISWGAYDLLYSVFTLDSG